MHIMSRQRTQSQRATGRRVARTRQFARFLLSAILTLVLSGCTGELESYLLPTPTPAALEQREQLEQAVTQPPAPIPPDLHDLRREQTVQTWGEASAPQADPAEPVQTTAADASDLYLAHALRFAPLDTRYFAYTNWEYLKAVAGVPHLTSQDSMEERIAFMVGIVDDGQAIAAGYGRAYLTTHADRWGWDNTDLVWEAEFSTESHVRVSVLRLRDDFDFSTLINHFEARAFTRMELEHGALYTHELDFRLDWLRSSEFGILNTVILPEENILVLASQPHDVLAAMDIYGAGPSFGDRPDIRATAAAFGVSGTAIIDSFGCLAHDPMPHIFLLEEMEEIRARIDEIHNNDIHRVYLTWGLAYKLYTVDEEEIPAGVVVHFYPVGEMAVNDLPGRRKVAEEGYSIANPDVPYADMLRVREGLVLDTSAYGIEDSAALVLVLEAVDRGPQLFFDMFFRRDMLFSICGR